MLIGDSPASATPALLIASTTATRLANEVRFASDRDRQAATISRLWQVVGVLLIGLVVYLSLTRDPIKVPIENGDKYGHCLAYATLMFWFAQIYLTPPGRIGWAVAFVAMGIGLEFLQRLTDYRTFEIWDMVADAVGACVGWIAAPPRSPHTLRYIEARWLGRSWRSSS